MFMEQRKFIEKPDGTSREYIFFSVTYNHHRDVERGADCIGEIERFEFYEEAKTAYAIIATGESALYANIMLQKGVVV